MVVHLLHNPAVKLELKWIDRDLGQTYLQQDRDGQQKKESDAPVAFALRSLFGIDL